MKFIAVDDEQLALDYLVQQIRLIDPSYEVAGFTDPFEAMSFVKDHPVEIAFLDIEMYGLNGIELAKRFKDQNPRLSIVFVTGFSQYAVDAFSVHACGYLLKPPTREAIAAEIDLAKGRQTLSPTGKRIRVQTFGSFEIFVDHTPVKFGRSKAKELLAYLVDRRGAVATVQELIGILYEDKDSDPSAGSLLRTLVSEMIHSLKAVGAADMVIKSRNQLSVDTTKFDCDFYNFLDGDVKAINSYFGEYMVNYSWAEFTTGFLDEKAKRE